MGHHVVILQTWAFLTELFCIRFQICKSPNPLNSWQMSCNSTEINRTWPNFSLKCALTHPPQPSLPLPLIGELTSGPTGWCTPLIFRYLKTTVITMCATYNLHGTRCFLYLPLPFIHILSLSVVSAVSFPLLHSCPLALGWAKHPRSGLNVAL